VGPSPGIQKEKAITPIGGVGEHLEFHSGDLGGQRRLTQGRVPGGVLSTVTGPLPPGRKDKTKITGRGKVLGKTGRSVG